MATDLAEALARAGTPFHQAHQIVGRLVLESVRQRQETGRLDRRGVARIRAGIHARYGARCSIRGGHENARDSRRHRTGGGGARRWTRREARLAEMAPMNKTYRQGQILKLIRAQADPHAGRSGAGAEASQGIAATQVTLSRDIRELRLVKTPRGLPGDAPRGAGPAVLAAGRPSSCTTCCARRTWWC